MTDKEVKSLVHCVANMRLITNQNRRYVASCLWHFVSNTGYKITESAFVKSVMNPEKQKSSNSPKVVRRRKDTGVETISTPPWI